MGWNISNILVNEAIANKKAGGGSGLTERVTALETTVGDESSGLVKDVDDLETIVGDSSGGLVKDVDDLETIVGDSSGGLVKDVTALCTYDSAVKIGTYDSKDLCRKIVTYTGNVNSAVTFDSGIPEGATLVHFEGSLTNASIVRALSFYATSSIMSSIAYNQTTGKFYFDNSGGFNNSSIFIMVYYTVTPPANNTRKGGRK